MKTSARFWKSGRSGIGLAIAWACAVATALAKDPTVYVIEGSEPIEGLGRAIAVIGDLDHDGVNDFAASSKLSLLPEQEQGKITLHSGKDGKVIRTIRGIGDYDDLGRIAMAPVPDLDGDGIPELYALLLTHGFVVLSPVTGERWYQVEKYIRTGGSLGPRSPIQWIEDLDGDGIQEFVGSIPTFSGEGPKLERVGVVTVFSTRTGEILWESLGQSPHSEFGSGLLAVSDFNSDGIVDLLAAEDVPEKHGPDSSETYSRVWVLSGRTGERLRSYDPPDDHYFRFGYGMASLGDRDGDGYPEVAIGAPYFRDFDIPLDGNGRLDASQRRRGWFGVYKLPEGELFFDLEGLDSNLGAFQGDQLGTALASSGDLDGDGIADILAGTYRASDRPLELGRIYAVSGRDGQVLTTYEINNGRTGSFTDRIVPLGDIDGDSRAEILIGEQGADGTGTDVPGGLLLSGRIFALRVELDGPVFLRGDANSDGRVNIADAVQIVLLTLGKSCVYKVEPGQSGPTCLAAYDVDASGCINWSDALSIISYLFRNTGGPVSPTPPFPACGRFSRIEEQRYALLGCEHHEGCAGLDGER